MAIIKGKGEKGSRSLRDIASAPVFRKNISHSLKETEKCDYVDIEEFEDPIKILVPNLLANKQKRLQINRSKKRAVTAGFSRSPLIGIGIESKYSNTTDCIESVLPELTSFDGFDTKRINSFSSHTTTQNKSQHNDSKEGRRKFSVLAADQSFLTVNSSFSDTSFRSRSPSIKHQRKKSTISNTRMGFTKLGLNIDSSYFSTPDAAIDDRFLNLKKPRLKAILKVLVEPLELQLKQKEEKLADAVLKRFKYRGIPIDKKVVEKGILHPASLIKKDLLEVKKNDYQELQFLNSRESDHKKTRGLKKRSESTKLLHITALVVEPKDTLNLGEPRTGDDGFPKTVKSAIKPRTNSWWTKAEYHAFHDNIQNYRQTKKMEREAKLYHKEFSFKYTGAAFASKKEPLMHYNYINRNGRNKFDQTDTKKEIWHERLKRLDDRRSAIAVGASSLFGKSKVFLQENLKKCSKQSRTLLDVESKHTFTQKPTANIARRIENADFIEVAFI